MIYLDNAATTRPITAHEEVKELLKEVGINPYDLWLNSHSSYSNGDYLLWICREKISKIINCDPNEIIFTSGGCEGNSMVNYAITTNIEHKSLINNPTNYTIKVNTNGLVYKDSIKEMYNNIVWSNRAVPKMVSIQLINNEVGVKQDIKSISEYVKKELRLPLHSDMVQALGKVKIDVKELGVDMATFSGHKIHGHKGVGFVYIGKDMDVKPLIYGGAQEFGVRGGTSDCEAILNMTARIMYCDKHLEEHRDKVATMKKLLVENLPNGCIINHINDSNIISIRTPLNGQYLVNRLAEKEIYISTGSACSTGEPSYVLKNLGLTNDECDATIRVSLDAEENSREDIDVFFEEIGGILNE